ncbi:putative cell agglutination protein [Dirofilaria immitis]
MDLKFLPVLIFVVSHAISFNTTSTGKTYEETTEKNENWSSTEIMEKIFDYKKSGEQIIQYLVGRKFRDTAKMAGIDQSLANQINSTNDTDNDRSFTEQTKVIPFSKTGNITTETEGTVPLAEEMATLSSEIVGTAPLAEEITTTLSSKTEETATLAEKITTTLSSKTEETAPLAEEITTTLSSKTEETATLAEKITTTLSSKTEETAPLAEEITTTLSSKTEETATLAEKITTTLSSKTEETATLAEKITTTLSSKTEETATLTEEITTLPTAKEKMTISLNENIISDKENNENINNIMDDRMTISSVTEKIIMPMTQGTTEASSEVITGNTSVSYRNNSSIIAVSQLNRIFEEIC